MDLFESTHIIAILGTASFMVAFGVVWYSLLFGGYFQRTHTKLDVKESSSVQQILSIGVTFLLYVCTLFVLSLLNTSLYQNAFSLMESIFMLAFVPVCFLSLLTFWERRGFLYVCMHAGFVMFFVIGGLFIIENWPW